MARLTSLTVDDTGSLTLPTGTGSNRETINTTVVSFTSVASTTWTVPASVNSIEILVVAGGGGGGRYGGGGGAGGVIYNPNYRVTPGQVISVTVGGGGAGHPGDAQNGGTATNGANSRFGDLIAVGGGGGGNYNQNAAVEAGRGASGGSGGGNGSNGNATRALTQMQGGLSTAGQGNRGGIQALGYAQGGGGGGGAGTGGFDGTQILPFGGAGGHGILSTISGSPVYYGGGGGGSCGGASVGVVTSTTTSPGGLGGGGAGLGPSAASTSIADGAANTGGGGGGTCDSNIGGTTRAGNGGSGVVIVRYALNSASDNPLAQTRFNSQTKSLETYKGNNKWEAHQIGEKIVTNGLRCYLDPLEYSGSGVTVYDLSGFGNNATLNGSITHNATVGFFDIGTGLDVTNYITIPAATLNGATEFTVNMWLQPNATNSIDTFFTCGPGNNNLFFFSGRNQLAYQNTAQTLHPYRTNLGEWILFTATGKNGVISVYKNGKFQNSLANNSTVNVTSTIGIILGNEMDAADGGFETGQKFLGRYGPVALYNRALSDGEVQQNYVAQRGRFGVATPYINMQHGAPGSSAELAAPSAAAIKEYTGTTQNGFYWIKPGNQEPIWVYCDMNYDGGGWVQVMSNARLDSVSGISGGGGIGAINYYQSINHVWYNGQPSYGSPGVNPYGTAGNRLKFRCLVGLRFWPSLGLNIAQFCATDAVSLSQTTLHTKRYRWSYTGFSQSFAFQGAAAVSDETGTGAPGMYTYHALNGFSWSTADMDQDATGSNCAANYGSSPWWYGACWDGNMYGGGLGGNGHADGPHWSSSGADNHAYMAVYLRV
jgi:hypothetical protein